MSLQSDRVEIRDEIRYIMSVMKIYQNCSLFTEIIK